MNESMILNKEDLFDLIEANSKSAINIDWHNWFSTYIRVSELEDISLEDIMEYAETHNFTDVYLRIYKESDSCYIANFIMINDLTKYEFEQFLKNYEKENSDSEFIKVVRYNEKV